ncbi:SUF system NifU family Fe-S cluster assembly protein [bacterium]|nr:SUF system NifU family Fe-S cluster assembly protein [bacterium]
MELKELYQEIILDHGKNPRNKGKCEGFTNDAKAHNPLCGDKVHVYLKLNKDKQIENLSFEGEGCAISLASASILTEIVKGKDLSFIKKISEDFLNMIKNKTKITINSLTTDQITTIASLSGIKSVLTILLKFWPNIEFRSVNFQSSSFLLGKPLR